MPLSQPAERALLHLRDIDLRGYLRADGLIEVEAHLADTKTYSFGNRDRGAIHAGERLHGMHLRMSLDRDLVVVACEAAMDETPYSLCPGVAPNFAALAGLRIGPGFIKGAMERVRGTAGCTHLRELLQQVATVAFQTQFSVRAHDKGSVLGAATRPDIESTAERDATASALLNSCYAYDENGPLIRRWRAEGDTAD